jgi:hypothetical protein
MRQLFLATAILALPSLALAQNPPTTVKNVKQRGATGISEKARNPDAPAAPAKPRVFELRTYTPAEGKADAMNKRFREHTCTLFQKHGMELIGFWTPREGKDKDKLVYILAFPSREAAAASWKAFQDDPAWQSVRAESEKDGKVVAKVESVFLDPTDYSPMK